MPTPTKKEITYASESVDLRQYTNPNYYYNRNLWVF